MPRRQFRSSWIRDRGDKTVRTHCNMRTLPLGPSIGGLCGGDVACWRL
jgi:hypothetical protein